MILKEELVVEILIYHYNSIRYFCAIIIPNEVIGDLMLAFSTLIVQTSPSESKLLNITIVHSILIFMTHFSS